MSTNQVATFRLKTCIINQLQRTPRLQQRQKPCEIKCIEPEGESQLGNKHRDTRERPCRSSSSNCCTISLSFSVSTVKMRSSSRSSFSSSAGSGPSSSAPMLISTKLYLRKHRMNCTLVCIIALRVAALFLVHGHLRMDSQKFSLE